jgi:hypothetical protein
MILSLETLIWWVKLIWGVFKYLKPRLLICGLIVVVVMINPKLAMGFVKISICVRF